MARPYVVINVAASVDGKIDTLARRGAAISTERDRQRVDGLRAAMDAVMVGGHTLVDEDPRLTVKSLALRAARLGRGEPENPAKVAVVSDVARLNPRGRFITAGPARIILFTPATASGSAESTRRERSSDDSDPAEATLRQGTGGDAGLAEARVGNQIDDDSQSTPPIPRTDRALASRREEAGRGDAGAGLREAGAGPGDAGAGLGKAGVALREAGVEIFALGQGRVDLVAALETLGELGIRSVLVEGGGSLNFELFKLGLVDEVLVSVAPLIFGGASAPTLADGAGLGSEAAIRLRRQEVEVWDDGGVLLRYKVEPRE